MAGEAREKCAVAGVLSVNEERNAVAPLYKILTALQHRGSDASGIASETHRGTLEAHREAGLVQDVYNEESFERLIGNTAIGHNRYPTSGSKKRHPQPVTDKAVGLAMAHNGNLPYTSKLETHLERHNLRYNHANDSEMMQMASAQYLRNGLELPDAIEKAYPLFTGAFSCVAMRDGLIAAFRDPYGIRPLALWQNENGYVVSSETCGLDIVQAEYIREVNPGEMLIITKNGLESRQLADGQHKLDIFEFVYFARHDSRLYGKSVNEVRRKIGETLAEEHPPILGNSDEIVVVPVPDTSTPMAEGYGERLDLKHRQAIIKNRYNTSRTFMEPSQEKRIKQLQNKHNVIPDSLKDKHVVVIDDSIVRLNTIPGIVRQIKQKQPSVKSVSVLIGSPPVRFPDFYGIDTPNQKQLAAANMTVEQMRKEIGCEYLGFLSLSGLVKATGLPASKFNMSYFTGEYPIDIGPRRKDINMPVSMEFVE